MKVLALDLSTTRTGWAVGEPGKVESFGSWKYPRIKGETPEDVDLFLWYAKKAAEKAVEAHISYCVGEDWVRGPSALQMLRSGALRGSVMTMLKFTTVLDIMFFPPSEWRKAAGIDLKGLPKKGRRKELKSRSIEKCQAEGLDVKNDDEAEACQILVGLANLIDTDTAALEEKP